MKDYAVNNNRSENVKMDVSVHGAKTNIKVSGVMSVDNVGICFNALKKFLDSGKSLHEVSVDLSDVTFMDTYGALIIQELRRNIEHTGGRLSVEGARPESSRMIALTEEAPEKSRPAGPADDGKKALSAPKSLDGILESLGVTVIKKTRIIPELVHFLGQTILATIHILKHPVSMRWNDVVLSMYKVGVQALPIIGLLSFLLGLIIAFMSAVQLKQFGANIYVASLVGLGMTRELGPIITCILMAGRSGAAFAAEIGTMKVSREVDALSTMGFDITRFLIMPKLIAAVAMVPFLTLFSDVLAVLGGLVVGVTMLDLTVASYTNQIYDSVGLNDVGLGVLKSMVFALLIAWAGCYWGMKVRGGADAVGMVTTKAVVSGIFLVIVCDAVFAVIQRYAG